MAIGQGFGQIIFVDHPTPSTIHQINAFLHPGDRGFGNEICGFGGQRSVDGDDIGLGEQLFERHGGHTMLFGGLRGEKGIVGDHVHQESLRHMSHMGADFSHTENPEGLVGKLHSHELGLLPLPGAVGGIGLRNLPDHRHHHRDGVFRRRDRVTARSIHDNDAPVCGSRQVHVVEPCSGASDHLQASGSLENLRRHPGPASDDQAIVGRELLFQLFWRKFCFDGDFEARVSEYIQTFL